MFLLCGEFFPSANILWNCIFFITPKHYHTYQLSMCQRLYRTNHFSFQTRARCLCQWQAFHCSRPCQVRFYHFYIFVPNLNLHFGICNCNFLPSKTVNQLLPAICMYDYSVLIWSKLYFHHISICVVKLFQCPDRPSSSSGGVEFFK